MEGPEQLPNNSGFQSHHACLYELSVKHPASKTFTWLDDKGGEVASLTVSEVRGEMKLNFRGRFSATRMIGYRVQDAARYRRDDGLTILRSNVLSVV